MSTHFLILRSLAVRLCFNLFSSYLWSLWKLHNSIRITNQKLTHNSPVNTLDLIFIIDHFHLKWMVRFYWYGLLVILIAHIIMWLHYFSEWHVKQAFIIAMLTRYTQHTYPEVIQKLYFISLFLFVDVVVNISTHCREYIYATFNSIGWLVIRKEMEFCSQIEWAIVYTTRWL